MLLVWMIVALVQITLPCKAQDSIAITTPSLNSENILFPDSIFNFRTRNPIPKRAGLWSACMPGLGQLYNKQYWKVGLVAAGGMVVGGFIISNYNEYNTYRKAYLAMIDNNPATPDEFEGRTVEDVKYLRDGFRRYLEYSVIAAGVGYIMNILDAFISAHLKRFDMSKDISLIISPGRSGFAGRGVQIGLRLN
jgi:hypothetical protein